MTIILEHRQTGKRTFFEKVEDVHFYTDNPISLRLEINKNDQKITGTIDVHDYVVHCYEEETT